MGALDSGTGLKRKPHEAVFGMSGALLDSGVLGLSQCLQEEFRLPGPTGWAWGEWACVLEVAPLSMLRVYTKVPTLLKFKLI